MAKKLKLSHETIRVLDDASMSRAMSGQASTMGSSNFGQAAPPAPPDPAEMARNRERMIRNFSWPHTFGNDLQSDADGAAWLGQHPNEKRDWKQLHPGHPGDP